MEEESGRLSRLRERCFVHRVCGSRMPASLLSDCEGPEETEEMTAWFLDVVFVLSLFFLRLNIMRMICVRVVALVLAHVSDAQCREY